MRLLFLSISGVFVLLLAFATPTARADHKHRGWHSHPNHGHHYGKHRRDHHDEYWGYRHRGYSSGYSYVPTYGYGGGYYGGYRYAPAYSSGCSGYGGFYDDRGVSFSGRHVQVFVGW